MSFECNVCHKIFTGDDYLFGHKIQKLQCSSCQYCQHGFTGRKAIRSHMKSKHLDFSCDICKKRFFLSAAVDTHTRMKHGSYSTHLDDMNRSPPPATANKIAPSTSSAPWVPYRSDEENTHFLSDCRSCKSLEKLLTKDVRPDRKKTKKRNEIVDYLAKFMQHNTKYSTREPVKGGSSGKGTSIKKKADIDLVVFINDYDSVAQLQENMDAVLKDLHDHMLKDATFASQIHFTRYTSHSIRFGVRVDSEDEMTEVDLLPAVALATGKGSKQKIFKKMSKLSPRDQSFYSVSFAKNQVQFVKRAPKKIKDLIRLVKHWKRREDISLVSYCIELIVIKQWEEGKLNDLSIKQGFKQVMGEISNLSSMQISWPSSKYGIPSAPAVMDPANPFINTAKGIRDVDTIESKAREIYNVM